GWWDEGYNGENGWAIGRGEEYTDHEYQDQVESAALYQLLENEIVPTFYDRGADDIPEKWIRRMKKSMTSLGPVFNTNRMVSEYTERFYISRIERLDRLRENECAAVRRLAAWKSKVTEEWENIRIVKVEADTQKEFSVGTELPVKALVALGSLLPQDVRVEIYYGLVDSNQNLYNSRVIAMTPGNVTKSGRVNFAGAIPCQATGNLGFTIRVMPSHSDLAQPFETNLITWGE
ncbi:alpha-glucan phosphorylase, partial [bacterium]|nr:alpha-glucan phosphorylase [bacterium]